MADISKIKIKTSDSDQGTVYNIVDSTAARQATTYTKNEVDATLNNKVDKVAGKGLSTNDYTNADKTKLDDMESGAQANVQPDWNQKDSTADDYIKNKPTIPEGVVVDQTYNSGSTNAQSGTAVAEALADKVDKETGKGLSTNDFTTVEKTKLSSIETGAEANIQSDWEQTDDTADDFIKNKPTIPTVNDGVLTIQKNGTSVGMFSANASTGATINITVPVDADDINALPDTTRYGSSLSLSINSTTYVITAALKDQDGNTLGAVQTIDLPLETVVVNGSYDNTTKKIILTLKNGTAVGFSVADLVAGLQSEITTTNKLSSDLVDDTNNAHKFVTATEKADINRLAAHSTPLVVQPPDSYLRFHSTDSGVEHSYDNFPAIGFLVWDNDGYVTDIEYNRWYEMPELVTDSTISISEEFMESPGYSGWYKYTLSVNADAALSSTSTNPVQNKVVKSAIDGKQDTLTAAQLAAVNSGITAELTQKILEADIDYSKCVGIQIDFANKSSKKLGAAADSNFNFDSYSTFSRRKLCTINRSTGVPTYITSYTGTPPNGLMVEQPAFYYKVVPQITRTLANGTVVVDKADYWISDIPRAGFKLHPAFINSSGNESPFYYIGAWAISGAESADDPHNAQDDPLSNRGTYGADGYLTSIYNYQPTSNHTRAWFRQGGTGVNTLANPKWGIVNAQVVAAEQLLMLIEFGPNLQTNLASGITSVTDNSSLNCSAYCGSTFSKGLVSGSADSTSFKSGITTNNNKSYSYRGVEDFYGNIWEWIDGMNIWGNGSLGGGKVFICSDWNYADDKKDDNYADTGIILPNNDGYIKSFAYSSVYDWLLITGEVGGDSAGPIGDYYYKTANLNGYKCALLGGRWDGGLLAGPCCWRLDHGSSAAGRYVGARLIYVP